MQWSRIEIPWDRSIRPRTASGSLPFALSSRWRIASRLSDATPSIASAVEAPRPKVGDGLGEADLGGG